MSNKRKRYEKAMLTVCSAEISSKIFWPKGPNIFADQKICVGDQILKLRSQLVTKDFFSKVEPCICVCQYVCMYTYIYNNSSQASVTTINPHKKIYFSQMRSNNKLFHTPIFRLCTEVFIRVNYSCPARVILFLQLSNKTYTDARVLHLTVNSPTRAR